MQHFWTTSNKVKERGWLNIGYNTQEVWEIQVGFKGVYCVFSGLCHKSHWQEFTVKWSKVQHLLKNWTKQPLQTFSASKGPHFIPGELLSITDQGGFEGVYCVFSGLHHKSHWQEFPVKWSKVQHLSKNWTKQPLQTFSASKGWHFIPGELLSITDQDILYQDIFKGHVHHMNHSEQLDDLLPQIREENLCDQGNAAQTSGINCGENSSAGIEDEVTHLLPLEGIMKADVTRMVEATAMVYKFMEEQHKLDSYLPNNHQSCKMERDLMNLLWPYAIDSAYQNVISRVGLQTYMR
jgi:hypothetical protein